MEETACKAIDGEPGYRACDDGSIWSQWQRTGKAGGGTTHVIGTTWKRLKPHVRKRDGRLQVCLSNGRRYVHQLILETFVGPCPQDMEAMHADDNPANNRLDNLSWGTHRRNIGDAHRKGRMWRYPKGERHPNAKLSESQIDFIRFMGRLPNRRGLRTTLAKAVGASHSAVSMILSGKRRTHI